MSNVVYYNANLFNELNGLKTAYYNEDRTQPLIDNPGQYYLSIIRFSIPATRIPILIFQDNFFSVTLSYGGNDSQVFLQYVPFNNFDPSDRSVIYFQQMMDSINNALNTAINTLVGAPTTETIKFFYTASTDSFDFTFPKSYVTNNIKFYMNNNLYYKFIVYNALYNGLNAPNGKIYQIVLQDTYNNTYDTNNYITRESSGTTYMFSIDKIVITTTMPINKENISSVTSDGNPIFANILTDFIVNTSTTSNAVSPIIYNPSAQFRYIDIKSNIELRNINYQIFYQFKDRTLYPLSLIPGESVNIKFMFIRKELVEGRQIPK